MNKKQRKLLNRIQFIANFPHVEDILKKRLENPNLSFKEIEEEQYNNLPEHLKNNPYMYSWFHKNKRYD